MNKDLIIKIVEIFLILLMFAAVFLCGMIYQIDYATDKLDKSGYMLKPVPILIAEHLNTESSYNIDTWDCSNMSDELVTRLRQQGYDAEYVGVKYDGNCHGIVKYTQYIESTRGTFINPNITEPYSFDRVGCRNVTER